MEPAKVRKRRYFSLAVICFTAFILALSISIVSSAAAAPLDADKNLVRRDWLVGWPVGGWSVGWVGECGVEEGLCGCVKWV